MVSLFLNMEDFKTATKKSHNYENFIAECPYCSQRNIFNRRDDLQDFSPITGRLVICLNKECRKKFYIGGDLSQTAYGYLLYDCHELLQEKRYMYCILNITQAYEVFFSTYLQIEILYKSFALEEKNNPYQDNLYMLNDLSKQ